MKTLKQLFKRLFATNDVQDKEHSENQDLTKYPSHKRVGRKGRVARASDRRLACNKYK